MGKANLSIDRERTGVSKAERTGEGVGASERVLSTGGRLSVGVPSAARERSSHFPRTALISKLPPTRWDGVHLRVALGVADEELELPVGVARRVLRDWEPARESVPARDDVRSNNAFWYANWPDSRAELCLNLAEPDDDVESDRSMVVVGS